MDRSSEHSTALLQGQKQKNVTYTRYINCEQSPANTLFSSSVAPCITCMYIESQSTHPSMQSNPNKAQADKIHRQTV